MTTIKHEPSKLASIAKLFAKLPVLRVVISPAMGFGDQVNTYQMLQRYLALGYNNTVEIIYPLIEIKKVATLFALEVDDLKNHTVFVDATRKMRFIEEIFFLYSAHTFDRVPLAISGAFSRSFADLKLIAKQYNASLFIISRAQIGTYINSFDGTSSQLPYERDFAIGWSNIYAIPSLGDALTLLKNTTYGRSVIKQHPGLLSLVEGVKSQTIHTQSLYGMHMSFKRFRDALIAKFVGAVCEVKQQHPGLQKPVLLMVQNKFPSSEWSKISKLLSNLSNLDQQLSKNLEKLRQQIIPCMVNQTIPLLSAGDDLVHYLQSAPPESVAVVKMPDTHPTIFNALLATSPFPPLHEGYSALALSYTIGKPFFSFKCPVDTLESDQQYYKLYVGACKQLWTKPDNLANDFLVNFMLQSLDEKSSLYAHFQNEHQRYCAPEKDAFFNLLHRASEHKALKPLMQKKSLISSQPLTLHKCGNLFLDASRVSAIIASCAVLREQKILSHRAAQLLRYSLLIVDGYVNEQLSLNCALIVLDATLLWASDSVAKYASSITFLTHFVPLVVSPPKSLYDAATRITEMGCSFFWCSFGRFSYQ